MRNYKLTATFVWLFAGIPITALAGVSAYEIPILVAFVMVLFALAWGARKPA